MLGTDFFFESGANFNFDTKAIRLENKAIPSKKKASRRKLANPNGDREVTLMAMKKEPYWSNTRGISCNVNLPLNNAIENLVMTVKIDQNSECLVLLVDTWSAINIIKKQHVPPGAILHTKKHKILLERFTEDLVAKNSVELIIQGHPVEFVIVDDTVNFPTHGIIELNFFLKTDCIMDFENLTIKHSETLFPLNVIKIF